MSSLCKDSIPIDLRTKYSIGSSWCLRNALCEINIHVHVRRSYSICTLYIHVYYITSNGICDCLIHICMQCIHVYTFSSKQRAKKFSYVNFPEHQIPTEAITVRSHLSCIHVCIYIYIHVHTLHIQAYPIYQHSMMCIISRVYTCSAYTHI